MDKFKHISFKKKWKLTENTLYQLGECDAIIEALSYTPLKPEDRQELLSVALIKGAQATTAIEGNTLSESEIEKIKEGWKLPPSKEYLEIEVSNILEAFNKILKDIVVHDKDHLITPKLVKDFHEIIGKNLGKHFDAIPGRFRKDSRVVGPYLTPDYKLVPGLIEKLCSWIEEEFHYRKGQDLKTAIIEAIVTHVYIEWIHPFADGNGRTGRLVEFYILLRAGLPNIVSHILSNFYNQTRSEYYRQLDVAKKKNDLTGFIDYAVQGFRDGLKENYSLIQKRQIDIFWHNYIYGAFSNIQYTKKDAFKRKRELMLNLRIGESYTLEEITLISPKVAQKYANVTKVTMMRDLKELQELNLLERVGKKYQANIKLLWERMPAKKNIVS